MRKITFVYAYYDNPHMLSLQYNVWSSYESDLKKRVSVIIVDDASPSSPAIDVPRPNTLPNISIYRVKENIPWHQDGARNLGAAQAENDWLFLTDMDHVMPESSLRYAMRLNSKRAFYTFDRLDALTCRPTLDKNGRPKPHPNTYIVSHELYWLAGGYDEDFCGVYGTDGMFRRQLEKVGRHVHLLGTPIIRYSREVMPDASTTSLCRKEYGGAERKEAAWNRKIAAGRKNKITTLAFEWEKLL